MSSPGTPASGQAPPAGPVLFAYDGSELAGLAVAEAARQLEPGRAALVACVWQPVDVGFEPVGGSHFDAADAGAVRAAAEKTAAHGAALAEQAGFRAQSIAVEGAPSWKGIVELAELRGASLIVIGSHRRGGLKGHLLGSLATAVISHSSSSVLIACSPAPAE